MAPPVEPFTELSEATRPPACPVPNSSGRLEICFSSPYETNDETVAPAPASPPTAIPTAVPRRSGQRSGHRSSNGSRGTARAAGRSDGASAPTATTCSSTSPMANRPMSTVTKSTPVLRNGTPSVKRSTPYCASVPIVPRKTPAKSEISVAAVDDWPSTDTLARPNTTTAKNSTVENPSANLANGGARNARNSALTRPPKADDMMASPSAYWVRPCRLSR